MSRWNLQKDRRQLTRQLHKSISRRNPEEPSCTNWLENSWRNQVLNVFGWPSSTSQRPHDAGEIWKRSFISTVTRAVHTVPPRKRSFLKTLFKLEELWKHRLCIFVWTEKRSFSKTMTSRYSCDFPDQVFLNHKSKMTGDRCVFKYLRRSVDRKHLRSFSEWNMRIQIPPA